MQTYPKESAFGSNNAPWNHLYKQNISIKQFISIKLFIQISCAKNEPWECRRSGGKNADFPGS
jgi:hypothetical protein